MILGVDLGYGYVKVTKNGMNVSTFPSIVGSGGERDLSTLLGGGQEIDEMSVEMDGHTYYVGELAAAASLDASRTIDRNKINHEHTKILLAAAVLLADPGEPIRLYTGLPLEYYRDQKEEFKKMLESITLQVKGKSGPFRGVEQTIRFQSVQVLPQAVGAIFSALMDEKGSPRYPELIQPDDPLALIDIGHKTTDFTVFQVFPRLKVIDERSGTIDIGAGTLYNMVRSHYPEIPEMDLERAVRNQKLWLDGKMLDLTDEVSKSTQSIAKSIMDEVKVRWGERFGRIRVVFLAGGGANLFKSAMEGFHPVTRFVDHAQGANAIGFWRMGSMKEETKQPPKLGEHV